MTYFGEVYARKNYYYAESLSANWNNYRDLTGVLGTGKKEIVANTRLHIMGHHICPAGDTAATDLFSIGVGHLTDWYIWQGFVLNRLGANKEYPRSSFEEIVFPLWAETDLIKGDQYLLTKANDWLATELHEILFEVVAELLPADYITKFPSELVR